MKKMKMLNLTPHAIVLRAVDGAEVTLPPSGVVARVQTTAEAVAGLNVDGREWPIVQTKFGQVQCLPEPEEGTVFVVSLLVLQAATKQLERRDLLAPDTGPTAIRNAAGQIIAVRGFQVP